MSLTVDDKKWLIRATGVKIDLKGEEGALGDPKSLAIILCRTKNDEQDAANERRKQKLIKEKLALIGSVIDEIDKATTLSLTSTSEKGKPETRDTKNRDLTQAPEFQKGGTLSKEGVDSQSEIGKMASQAQALIALSKQQLQAEMADRYVVDKKNDVVKGPSVRLFTDDEIMEALYDPLIRTGDISDSLVEDSMSRNQQMIDKTNASYKKELTDPSKDPPVFGFKDLMSNGVDLASSITGAVLESQSLMSRDDVKALLSGSTEAAKLLLDVGDAMLDGKKSLNYDTINKLIGELPAMVGDFVTGGTGSKDLGSEISSSLKAAAELPAVFKSIKDKKPEDLIGAAATMLESIGKTVEADVTRRVDILDKADKSDSTAVASQKSDDKTAKLDDLALKSDIGGIFAALAKGTAPKLVAAIRSGKKSSVQTVLFQFADDMSSTLGTVIIDKKTIGTDETLRDQGNQEKQLTQPQDQDKLNTLKQQEQSEKDKLSQDKTTSGVLTSIEGTVTSATKGMLDGEETAKTTETSLQEKPKAQETERQKSLRETREKYQKMAANEIYEELEKQGKEERERIEAVLKGGGGATEENIGKMLADMQRDAALVSMLMVVAKGGLSVAAKLLPALGALSDAPKLYANMKKAYDNYDYMTKFIEEHESALGSYSAYGPAIENFVNNQSFQFKRNSVAAAATGLGMIASVVAAAVPAAAPAHTVIASVGTAVDMGFQAKQAAKLRKAWKETKKSLLDPKNRSLAQKVRQMNPTLAKHVIAFGVTEKDPVALSFAQECGLTAAALNDPEATQVNVKKFLEAKFKDDPSLKGYFDDGKTKWKKEVPTPEVRRATLLKTYAVLKKNFTDIAGELGVPGNVLGGVNFVESQKLPAKDPKDMSEEERKALKEALTERVTICEQVEANLREEGKRIAKAANDNAIAEVFEAFADATSNAGFDAFLKHAAVSKIK